MAICYKTKDGKDFLYRISYKSAADILADVDALNANKPLRDGLNDLSNVDYFYATEVNVW